MSQASYPGGRGGTGVRPQSRPNDIYTLLLALAAIFLAIACALLAIEQFTFYGELFPKVEKTSAAPAVDRPTLAVTTSLEPADSA